MDSCGAIKLVLLVTTLTVSCYAAPAGVNISVYNLNTAKLSEIVDDPLFRDVIGREASEFCAENCSAVFQSNLTAELSNVVDDNPNSNVTVIIITASGDRLSVQKIEAMFEARHEQISSAVGLKITKAGEKFFGIKADNSTNLVVTIVFLVFTLVFSLIVLYLARHKVNHEKEHYEGLQEKGNSNDADGEIAT